MITLFSFEKSIGHCPRCKSDQTVPRDWPRYDKEGKLVGGISGWSCLGCRTFYKHENYQGLPIEQQIERGDLDATF